MIAGDDGRVASGGGGGGGSGPSVSIPKSFRTVGHTKILDYIVSRFSSVEICSIVGYLKRSNIYYVTVDDKLYLVPMSLGSSYSGYSSNAHNTNEFISYSGFKQVITTVREGRPQPNFFSDSVAHTLIVSTTNELQVLALKTVKEGEMSRLQLLPTNVVTTTESTITAIETTKCGRIIVGDAQGDISEIVYTSEGEGGGILKGIGGIVGKVSFTSRITIAAICGHLRPFAAIRVFIFVFAVLTQSLTGQVLLGDDRKKARKINHTSMEWVPSVVRSLANKVSSRGGVKQIKVDDCRNIGWGIWKDGSVECWSLSGETGAGGKPTSSTFGAPLKHISHLHLPSLLKTYLTILSRGVTYSSNSQIHIHSGSLQAVGGSSGARNILKTIASTTYTSIHIVPTTKSRLIQAFISASNGLKIYLSAQRDRLKISHVSCPLDHDYRPENVAASNLYTAGGTEEIHFEGNLSEGVEVYGVGDGEVVVDRTDVGGSESGVGSGATARRKRRNQVYCHSPPNTYSVSPIEGEVCEVVDMPDNSYYEELVRKSKTPNDSVIAKIPQPVKVAGSLRMIYRVEAKENVSAARFLLNV